MIVLIDNYDSFTFNLYHQLAVFDEVQVIRNDAITVEQLEAMQPTAIVISPGPGNPTEAGICIEVIKKLHTKIPILGICLGHQSIGQAFGAKIVRAKRIIHGKTSVLQYEPVGLLQTFIEEVEVMRYHSLVIDPTTLSADFVVAATASDDGEIMAIHHQRCPLYGLQFHPESIGSKDGKQFIASFMEVVKTFSIQRLLERFEEGEEVGREILKHALEATPFIEQTLKRANDDVIVKLLNEVVRKLPFYAALVLHDCVMELATRNDLVGETAKQSLHMMQP